MSMTPTRRLLLLALAGLATGWTAHAGSISGGREVRYPTEFETRTQVINGKVTTVTVPTRFQTRSTGTRMETEHIGVVRLLRKDRGGRDLVRLRFEDGHEAEVITGGTFEVGGVTYRALGWRGRDYCLMDLRTRELVRFQLQKASS
jgi:hypothetical protein